MLSHQEKVILPRLPLAIYQELAVHLRQLPGIETKLIPQDSLQFDYQESQVGGMILTYDAPDNVKQKQVADILQYYSDRYCGSHLERLPLN
jgi:hypothetical protein